MPEEPGPLAPTSTQTIDGGLYAETFVPATVPKGVVVITHGYAEHCGRYHEVANVIVRAGWAALSYDVRGHGKSPGKKGFIEHYQIYLDDLDSAVTAAKKLVAADAPLVLLGHSHGGLITLRALCADRPPAAKAAIISSPLLGLRMPVPSYKKVLARIASRIAPSLGQPNQIRGTDLTHDAAKIAEHDADKLCFDIATARWFTESTEAQQYVHERASRIAIPLTWVIGGADPITDPVASRRVADAARASDYHEYPEMLHEVFNEVGRGEVFEQVRKRLAST